MSFRELVFSLFGIGWKGETMTVIDSMSPEERGRLREVGAIFSLWGRQVPAGFECKMALRPGTRLTEHRNRGQQLRDKASRHAWIPDSLIIMSGSSTTRAA